jgi:Protein of unknown function (DUF2970)
MSSWARSFKTVAWSFFGVRKRSGHDDATAQLKPQQVIVAGIVAAALFVLALVLLVNWVIGSGVAAS